MAHFPGCLGYSDTDASAGVLQPQKGVENRQTGQLYSLLMQTGSTSLMLHSYLRRVFVIFFLLFPSIDFAAPDLCAEDLGGLAKIPSRDFVLHNCAGNELRSDQTVVSFDDCNSQQNEYPDPGSSDDDECYCCCAHVLPAMSFDVNPFEHILPIDALKSVSIPTPPSRATYHPPRFA